MTEIHADPRGGQDTTPGTPGSQTAKFLERLRDRRMLAVLRGGDARHVVQASETLIDAGIEIIEVTFTVPACGDAIRELRSSRPDALIGAGTVTSAAQLQDAVEAGAQFVVTPGTTPTLMAALAESPVPFLPGVLTPSEVLAARDAGAVGVKLFPGSFAGPSAVKALLGPFPDLRIVPTGGVSPENLTDWIDAGAFAVGAGNDLAPPEAVNAGDHDQLQERAAAWLSALKKTPVR